MKKSKTSIQINLTYFLLIFWATNFTLKAQKPSEDTLKVRFKRYEIKKYKDQEKNRYYAQVFKEGKKVLDLSSERIGYLQFIAINGKATYDITGDSINNFIFQQYLGGPQEETIWMILSLGRFDFAVLDTIRSIYSTPWLGDLDRDGTYEMVVKDYVMAYWNASFLDSPYENVVLRFREGAYRVATDLMFNPDASYEEKEAQVIREQMQVFYEKSKNTYPHEINVLGGSKEQRWGFISPTLWSTMMRLIYHGREDLAREFLDKAWFEGLEGKAEFWTDFREKLSQSPYWEAIVKMNQEAPKRSSLE